MRALLTVSDLEDELSQPTEGALAALQAVQGDVMVLGAGGKMGPTLARMLRRALNALGQSHRRVLAVSRFSNPAEAESLQAHGVEVLRCDLMDRAALAALPAVENVFYLAGQKFGTSDAPEKTWVMNTLVPALVAERFAASRIVVFSTGCVYPLAAVAGPGSREGDALTPPGEYANSCVGRERVFEHFSKTHGTPMLLYRLSYAIDLRYGVLVDVAQKVQRGEPVDVTMGYANVIWQGDANARAIQCLEHVSCPPMPLNVTGLERVSVRELAARFGELMGKPVNLIGKEADEAWLFDAAKSYELFGPPRVTVEEMIEATAQWLMSGGETHGKPTHFEVRDGTY